jgi:cell division protein FtsI/penicillin-binding protein 2
MLDLPIPPGALQAVRSGMKSVVGTPGGTGHTAFHPPGAEGLGFDVCGKSGTAQIDTEGTKMVWFEGFAPAEKPKVAFAVLLERLKEGSGGKDAAPVARDLLRWCKELGYLND